MDNALYRDGARVPTEQDGSRHRWECSPGEFQWVGLFHPTADELAWLGEAFGLHPLALEDAGESHQRPKLELYDDMVFLVLKTLWYVDEHDAVETGEINLFVGPDYVITVRHGQGVDLTGSRRDLESRAFLLEGGPASVMYAVCDRVVDEYEQVAGELEVDVDEVEEAVFSPERSHETERIYTLKRELAEFRRAVLPLREPMRRCAEGRVPGVRGETATHFRDVADHTQRVSEAVDNLDYLLSTAFDAQLARISVQQNEDMRKISAGAALVVVPTLIAGIYGMNFENMPELDWLFGYPFAISLMLGTALVLFWLFKRSRWL